MEDRVTTGAAAPAGGNRRLRITLVRSMIGYRESQRLTVKSLGLRKINHSVEHYDTPTIRGMVTKVRHLVRVEELPEGAGSQAPRETGTQRFAARMAGKAAARKAFLAELGFTADGEEVGGAGAIPGRDLSATGAGTAVVATGDFADVPVSPALTPDAPTVSAAEALAGDEVAESGTIVFRPTSES